MTKTMKKTLSLIIVTLMVLSGVPVGGLGSLDFSFATKASAATAEIGSTTSCRDFITLGSYPQSQVKDEAITAELDKLAPSWENWTSYDYYSGTGSYGSMTQGDWMRYTDVTYGGERYRGVKFTQYRPIYSFDPSSNSSSYQDDNGYSTNTTYWFKFESLKWRVLDANTGLIMCETIIDSQPYSNNLYANSSASDSAYIYFNDSSYTHYASDYETSSIRAWLNDDFYNTAFTSADQSTILTTALNNDSHYSLKGTTGYEKLDSNGTKDKIFLLSYDEAINSKYGFSSNDRTYDTVRQAQGSDYAKCHGLWVSNNSYKGYSVWLLRSAGESSDRCCEATYFGSVSNYSEVCNSDAGVRPALKLNLDSIHNLTLTAAKSLTSCTDGGNVEYWYCESCETYFVENEDGEKVATTKDKLAIKATPVIKNGEYILLGSYPQSQVTNEAITAELDKLAPSWENWTSYGYYSGTDSYGTMTQGDWMRYTDVTYGGERYRGVKFTQYRPVYTYFQSSENKTYQKSNGYNINTIYWFKFKPLKWRVLDASTGLIMCETVIDAQPYTNTYYVDSSVRDSANSYFNDSSFTHYANDYETSSIRAWLNDDFYNTAFASADQSIIEKTKLNNDGYYTSIGTTGYEAFDSNETNDNIFLLSYRDVINSSYGFSNDRSTQDDARKAQNSDYAKCQGVLSDDGSPWFLRSAGGASYASCFVTADGNTYSTFSADTAYAGIRPALKLNLDSIHNSTHTAAKAPTSCTDGGNVEYWYCDSCETYFVENEDGEKVATDDVSVPATGHSFGNVQHKIADCLSGGYDYKQCSNCSKYFAPDAATNATNGKDSADDFVTEATGHSFGNVQHKDANCLNTGYDYKQCSTCNKYFPSDAAANATNGKDSADDFVTEAAGHSFGNVQHKNADCLNTGYDYKQCSTCNKYFPSDAATNATNGKDSADDFVTEATGHSFGNVQHKIADCLSGGYDYKQCSNCSKYFAPDAATNATNGKDDFSSFTTQKLNHSYTGAVKSDGNGKTATHSFMCVNGCGQYGGTTAHEWNDGEITTPASHLKEGVKTYKCHCGGTYTETISKLEGHTYTPTVVDPTCTEQGYTEHKCPCGDSYKDTYVDATGHDYKDGVCGNCGDKEDSSTGEDPTTQCDCLCHYTNRFIQFIYKIVLRFWKLLKWHKTCDCGTIHY